MRKFAPTSLRGQVLVVIVLALALAQALGLWLFSDERNLAVRAALTGETLDRAGNIVALLERTQPAGRAAVLAAANSPLIRFSVDQNPALSKSANAPPGILAQLRQKLGPGHNVRVQLYEPGGRPSEFVAPPGMMQDMPPGMSSAMRQSMPMPAAELQLSAQLSDGRWLNITSRLHSPPLQWAWPDLATFAISATILLAAVWLLLGRIIQPLKRLAGAADRVGYGEWVDEIPAQGPNELARVTTAFNRMQTRLKRYVEERERILAALSHDLRSPLTALRVRAEMVEESETRDALISSIGEMQEMVEATLAFARAGTDTEAVTPVEAGEFLRALADEYQKTGRAVTIAPLSATSMVRLRPISMRRALRNLIDNALRYGEHARIWADAAADGGLAIHIEDDGPGIAPEDLARVFEPFVRLEGSRSRETGGTGLGLAIARSIVRAHGGELDLANKSPRGLRATILLPQQPIARQARVPGRKSRAR